MASRLLILICLSLKAGRSGAISGAEMIKEVHGVFLWCVFGDTPNAACVTDERALPGFAV